MSLPSNKYFNLINLKHFILSFSLIAFVLVQILYLQIFRMLNLMTYLITLWGLLMVLELYRNGLLNLQNICM